MRDWLHNLVSALQIVQTRPPQGASKRLWWRPCLQNVMHKPFAEEECHVMLVEPRGVVNTGELEGDLTAENDVWV